MPQRIKDPALSLLWHRFDPWPRNFLMPQVWSKKTTQNTQLPAQAWRLPSPRESLPVHGQTCSAPSPVVPCRWGSGALAGSSWLWFHCPQPISLWGASAMEQPLMQSQGSRGGCLGVSSERSRPWGGLPTPLGPPL